MALHFFQVKHLLLFSCHRLAHRGQYLPRQEILKPTKNVHTLPKNYCSSSNILLASRFTHVGTMSSDR